MDQVTFNKVFGATGLGKVGRDDEVKPINDVSQIQRFSQEEIEWIGKCLVSKKVLDPNVGVYMARHHNDHVFLGVSPYRLVIASDEKKMRYRSYWWEVKCGEQHYSEGNLQFKGLNIDPPFFRSAPLQRDILIHIKAVQMDGTLKRVDEIMLHTIEQKVGERKFKSGRGQEVSDRMMAAYNQRIPVSCEQLHEWLSTGEVKTVGAAPSVEPRQPEPAVEELKQPEPIVEKPKKSVPESLKCPNCGKPIEKDWKTCPYCAHPIAKTCPKCSKPVEPDWKACPYCGELLKK